MTVNLSTNLAYLGDITATNIIRVLPTRWRHEPAGIDIGQNYVTVTYVYFYCATKRSQEISRSLTALLSCRGNGRYRLPLSVYH